MTATTVLGLAACGAGSDRGRADFTLAAPDPTASGVPFAAAADDGPDGAGAMLSASGDAGLSQPRDGAGVAAVPAPRPAGPRTTTVSPRPPSAPASTTSTPRAERKPSTAGRRPPGETARGTAPVTTPTRPAPTRSAPTRPAPTRPAGTPAAASTSLPVVLTLGSGTPSAAEAEVIRLVNVERAAAGCPALAVSPVLQQVARAHSLAMSAPDAFRHNSTDGRTPFQRLNVVGYDYLVAGENIAAGQPTAAAVMAAWMASDQHKDNILDCRFTQIGVGMVYRTGSQYGTYWTQDIAAPM